MIVDHNFVNLKVEHSFSHLLFGWSRQIKFELLSHFLNFDFFFKIVILDTLISSGEVVQLFRVGNTSVDELVWSILVSFKGLVTNLFLSVDKSILVSMMVEVYLSILIINLNEFLPVIGMLGALIMFNGLELIRKSSSKKEFISSKLEE